MTPPIDYFTPLVMISLFVLPYVAVLLVLVFSNDGKEKK